MATFAGTGTQRPARRGREGGADDLEALLGADQRFIVQDPPQRLDSFRGLMGHVGQGALDDPPTLTAAFTQHGGGTGPRLGTMSPYTTERRRWNCPQRTHSKDVTPQNQAERQFNVGSSRRHARANVAPWMILPLCALPVDRRHSRVPPMILSALAQRNPGRPSKKSTSRRPV